LFNSVAQGYSANDVAGELMNLKLSTNKSMKDCMAAAANSVFSLIIKKLDGTDKKPLHVIMETVETWGSLIQKFIKDDEAFSILLRRLYVD
jgi:hypothetical protein